MRLLVLGGTSFVGHAVASAAVARGWQVTTFNRGLSGPDVPQVRPVRGDRTQPGDVEVLAAAGRWDAVVDTSGYVPRNVLGVAKALSTSADRYVFMSTVSVYADWPAKPLSEESAVLYCPPDAGSGYGQDTEDGPTQYGYQKAGCEAAARAAFGPERSTILRPGVVLGPREYIGRLLWWLKRVAAGGRVLAPGSPSRTIQPVDVRDLAEFALRTVSDGLSDVYNVCAPVGGATFGELLSSCAEATGADASFVWVPDEVLLANGVRQWSEMPLWRTFPGVWRVDSSKAHRVGLHCRPLRDTVSDTWDWLVRENRANDHQRAIEIGIGRAKEERVRASLWSSGQRLR